MDVEALLRGMELEISDAVNEVMLPTHDVQSSADVSAMLAEFHATRFHSAGAEPSSDLHGLRARLLAAVAQASVAIKATASKDPKQTDRTIAALRAALEQCSLSSAAASATIEELVDAGTATTRAGYLVSLSDMIPRRARPWQEEWHGMSLEAYLLQGHSKEAAVLRAAADTIEAKAAQMSDQIEQMVNDEAWAQEVGASWYREDARDFTLIQMRAAPLAAALRERSDRFSASTYRIAELLFDRVRAQRSILYPKLYKDLSGQVGLALLEPAWLSIEMPDSTGFCGLTCSAVVVASCRHDNFLEGGESSGVRISHMHAYVPLMLSRACIFTSARLRHTWPLDQDQGRGRVHRAGLPGGVLREFGGGRGWHARGGRHLQRQGCLPPEHALPPERGQGGWGVDGAEWVVCAAAAARRDGDVPRAALERGVDGRR